jgi:hypothetical protein
VEGTIWQMLEEARVYLFLYHSTSFDFAFLFLLHFCFYLIPYLKSSQADRVRSSERNLKHNYSPEFRICSTRAFQIGK